MSFDLSRETFRPERDFARVVMQQGRVQIDADANEQAAIVDRRLRAAAVDLAARAFVPAATPDGFRIERVGDEFTIGAGRFYVDGLVAENRGGGAPAWDSALGEWRGDDAVAWDQQPWGADPAPVLGDNALLVYLEVWRRAVTATELPDLIDPAVGVDSAAREQTVWRVRALEAGASSCEAAAGSELWRDLTAPSPARLTIGTTEVTPVADPCRAPVAGGYRGLENQLYRIEVHQGGPAGTATFKWSRDNASIAARVQGVEGGGTRLLLDTLGRDDVLGFRAGDWIEINTDARALAGEPGELRRIAPAGGVEAATRAVTVTAPVPAEIASGAVVRRWDQSGRVLRDDGGLLVDLDADGAGGGITIPADGVAVALEDGISVAFALQDGTAYRAGDWWLAAARAADASVEPLDQAPPHGPVRHFAPLAIVSTGGIEDCRRVWPQHGGDGCGCTVSVAAGEDLAGVVARLPQDRQLQLCLSAGEYHLRDTLALDGGGSGNLRITGCGPATRIRCDKEAALFLSRWASVQVEDLAVTAGAAESGRREGIGLLGAITTHQCGDVTMLRVHAGAAGGRPSACLRVHALPGGRAEPGMALARIRDCTLKPGTDGVGLLVSGARTSDVRGNRVTPAPPVPGGQRARPGAILVWPASPGMVVRGEETRQIVRGQPRGYVLTVIASGRAQVPVLVPMPLEDAWQALYPPGQGRFLTSRELASDLRKRKQRIEKVRGRGFGRPFEDWFAGAIGGTRGGAPAAGLVIAGATAQEVRVDDNDIEGCRTGIRIAVSRQAPRNERLTVGRATATGNRIILPASTGDGALTGIFVGNADDVRVRDNAVSVEDAVRPVEGEGIRVYGTLGRFLSVRENHVSGLRTGILVRPVAPVPPRPLWIVRDNLLEMATEMVPAIPGAQVVNNLA